MLIFGKNKVCMMQIMCFERDDAENVAIIKLTSFTCI